MSHKRSKERNHRLKKLYDETKNSYGAGAYLDEKKDRYVRYSCSSKYWKQYSNRRFRRIMNNKQNVKDYGGKNSYKKYTEYWWEIL